MRSTAWLGLRTALLGIPSLVVSCVPASRHAAEGGAPEASNTVPPRVACEATDVWQHDPHQVQPPCSLEGGGDYTWGPQVPVTSESGDPPVPEGGALVPGFYVLVSKTVFGVKPFDSLAQGAETYEAPELANGLAREAAYVSCDTISTLYDTSATGDAPPNGSSCRKLVARSVSLAEVSFVPNPGGGVQLIDMSQQVASYTAHGDTLTVISLRPQIDLPLVSVVGSYTIVDRFVLVSKNNADAGSGGATIDASATVFAPGEPDPRCPPSPPTPGDPCDPKPVPLQCEYGGDAWGRCTTFAECSLVAVDGGGQFEFGASQGNDCAPNQQACPRDYFHRGVARRWRGRRGRDAAGRVEPLRALVLLR
jgi:hypothetical protein